MVKSIFKRSVQSILAETRRRFHTSPPNDSSRLLAGKVAIITGASSGIGAATAQTFAQNGAKVVIADVQDDRGRDLAHQLGSDADYVHCDVSKEADVEAAVNFAVSKYGQLDIMFNNAGICTTDTKDSALCSISQISLADFERVCNVNLKGTFLGVKHASRVMIPRRTGSIISTASVTAITAVKSCHSYVITKHGIVGVTKTAASELGKYGLRVNCISPGVVSTQLATETIEEVLSAAGMTLDDLLAKNSQISGVKVDTSDIANAALFLASNQSRYISGHNLVVDGGFSVYKLYNPFKDPHLLE